MRIETGTGGEGRLIIVKMTRYSRSIASGMRDSLGKMRTPVPASAMPLGDETGMFDNASSPVHRSDPSASSIVTLARVPAEINAGSWPAGINSSTM